MKAQLTLSGHGLAGHPVIEVWYRGALIATVAGADGPGIRIVSKHLAADTISRPDLTGHHPMEPAKSVGVYTVMLDIPELI